MPKITVQKKTLECEAGANLRHVLIENGIALHNGNSKLINCRGIGSCGTCAVLVEGEVSEPNWKDRGRRSLPPHNPERPLRLACQTRVLDDITVKKYDQFWGHGQTIVW
ncbi:MAG: 2Fe-2S iron-sulfur cluster-binding protein [Cyanobacteria bacterium P01_F01_bin.13]